MNCATPLHYRAAAPYHGSGSRQHALSTRIDAPDPKTNVRRAKHCPDAFNVANSIATLRYAVAATKPRLAVGVALSRPPSLRHVIDGRPTIGGHGELQLLTLICTMYVDAPPELYIVVTSLPSGFLNAIASPPLVAMTCAPGARTATSGERRSRPAWRTMTRNLHAIACPRRRSSRSRARLAAIAARRVVAQAHRVEHHVPGAIGRDAIVDRIRE